MKHDKMSFLGIAFSISLFLAPNAMGEEKTLSLAECRTVAEKTNPDILSAAEKVAENLNRYYAFRGVLFPQADAAFSYQRYQDQLPSKKALFGPSLDDYYSELTVRQLFYSGGKYISQMKSADAGYEAEKAKLEQVKRETFFSVSRAYYEQLRAQHSLHIQQAVLDKLKEQETVAQLLYNSGKTSVVDVLKIQTKVSSYEAQVQNSQNRTYLQALSLGQAMGIAEPVKANFELPKLNEQVVFARTLPEAELQSNPEAAYARRTANRYEHDINAYSADRMPSLYGRASYFREDSTFFPDNPNWYAGVYLSLPLFRGGTLKAQTEQAKQRHIQALENLRKTQLALSVRYQSAVASLIDKKNRVAVLKKTLALAKETLTATELRYSAGKISVLDLLDAENSWQDAYLAYASLILDYLVNAEELKTLWPQSIRGELLQ